MLTKKKKLLQLGQGLLGSGVQFNFESAPELAVLSFSSTTNDLAWSSVYPATSYQLERATDGAFSDATVIYSGSNTTYTDSGSTNDHYYYRVKAKASGYNDSDYSNIADSIINEIGAYVWLRGDLLTTSGLEVTQWTDKSLLNHAVPVSARNTPQLLASQINSQDVVDFISANSEILEIPAPTGLTTYTLYLVFKADGTSGVITLLSNVQNGSGTFINQGFNLLINSGVVQTTNRDGSGQQSKTFAFTDTASYHVVMVKFKSNGAGISKLISRLDSTIKLDFADLNSISANNNKIYLGSVIAPPSATPFDGKMAEVILFSDYHYNLKQQLVHNYLKSRYAFSYTFVNDGDIESGVLTNITYSSSIDSINNLFARIAYDDNKTGQPILVLMHGFSQTATDFIDATYRRFRSYGYFVVGVGMRGRNGASGTQDASGREIHDIYDAIEYVKTNYPTKVNANRKIALGYSGGGGNILGLVSKHPDYFCLAIDFFGISDYGYVSTFSYYDQTPSQQATLQTWVGTPAAKPNEYKSRQHLWSASNAKCKLRMYHDLSDSSVNVNHSQRLETQLIADGFTNYVYSESKSGDANRWLHGLPNIGQTGQENIAAEIDFVSEGFTESIPAMPHSGTLKVNGYLKCSLFTLWLGNGTSSEDGRCRRATLTYNYDTNSYTLVPSLDSPATDLIYSFTDDIGRTSSGTISSSTPFTPA